MALIAGGSRNSVTVVLAPSAAATVGSMAHSLPAIPNRWGWSFTSALAIVSGGAPGPLACTIFSADAVRLYYRMSVNHVQRKNVRIWAEATHSLVR